MYIKSMTEENKNIYISSWLLLITFLVVSMIIVGGLTRLTDSGLSITKWDLKSGILPPLSFNQWEATFNLYKKIPEYQLLNSSMTLDEFKLIFWWEYIHRLLGRIVGLVYIIPLIYFTIKKKITITNLLILYFIFFLICLQGFIGWYMVSSGLTERTDVSHYRLSLHLTLAFVIFILLVWNYLKITINYKNNHLSQIPFYLPAFFLIFILLQISIGALVSGLNAGEIYQSWPLMNQNYFPDDSNIKDLFGLNVFENPSLIQFIHRNLAYLIFLIFIIMLIIVFKNKNLFYLKKNIIILFAALLLQILLGILTILSGAQIILASLHQIGSIFLITASLILVFKNSKIN